MLAALLLLQVTTNEPRAIVDGATMAAERGTIAQWLAPWQRRPTSDRAANLARGSAAFHLYQFAEAASRLRRADAGSADDIARLAQLGLGRILVQQGRYLAADSLLIRVDAQSRAAADTATAIESLLLRAGIGRRVRSAAAANAILDTVEALGASRRPNLAASMHCRRAGNAALTGDYAAMRRLAQLGIAAAQAARSLRLEAACHFVRATTFARMGLSDSVSRAMDTTVALQRRSGDLIAFGAAQQWAGFYAVSLGNVQGGERYLAEAWTAATASRSVDVLAWTALSRASASTTLNNTRAARRWLATADSLMRLSGDAEGLRTVLRMRAITAFAAGDTSRGWPLALEFQQQAVRAGDVTAQRDGLFTLVRHALIAGDRPRTRAYLDSLATLIRGRGMQGFEPSLRAIAGEAALLDEQWSTARREFDAVLGSLHASQYAFRHAVETMRAIALVRDGRLAEGAAAAQIAEDEHRRWRASIADSALRRFATATERGGLTYHTELVRLLAGGGRHREALRLAESQRALRLREQLLDASAWATGNARSRPEAAPVELAEVQQRLPDDSTAVVEYVLGEFRMPSVALVITRRGAWSFDLPSAVDLRPEIQRLLAAAEQGRSTTTSSRALGRVLFEPLRVPFERAGIRRVIIVADGAMHLIPFVLLEVGGVPAVGRWTMSEAPSVAVAMDGWTRPTRVPSGPIVALGDPVVRTPGGRTRPLPGARDEVRALQRRSAGAMVRVDGGASESYLKALPTTPRLLHVAAHGEVDDWDGRQAALLLSADAANDGRWFAGEIATLPFDDTLVVLSACRTNLGDLIAGEGVTGLTSAFLQAGARTVLATAWRIPDREIVPLVERFYDGLGAGLTAGAALQAAQVDARRRGAPASVWAAFRLVGDPYLTVSLR